MPSLPFLAATLSKKISGSTSGTKVKRAASFPGAGSVRMSEVHANTFLGTAGSLQRHRRHLTFRHYTSAEGLKAARADFPHEVFRKDASTRIPGTDKEYFEMLRRSFHAKSKPKSRSAIAKRDQSVVEIRGIESGLIRIATSIFTNRHALGRQFLAGGRLSSTASLRKAHQLFRV
jgi:hypothetical protein